MKKLNAEILTRYFLDELGPSERAAVDEALTSDPEAQRTLAELRGAAALARQAFHTAPAGGDGLSGAQRENILAEARGVQEEDDADRRPSPWARVARVAAFVFIPLALAGSVAYVAVTSDSGPWGSREVRLASNDEASSPESKRMREQMEEMMDAQRRLLKEGGDNEDGLQHRLVSEEKEAPAPPVPGLRGEPGAMTQPAEPQHRVIPMTRIEAQENAFALGLQTDATEDLRERRFEDDPSLVYWPGHNTESYDHAEAAPFIAVEQQPLSTFSIDVDTASYANVRRFLTQGQMPPPDAVRIEEIINYFDYGYAPPAGETLEEAGAPFAVHLAAADCPWAPTHRLVRIGLKAWEPPAEQRPASNLVFLLDVSGSMQPQNKLPLLKKALRELTERLDERDTVTIVTYAGSAGEVLPPTTADNAGAVRAALERLSAGGSTAGGAGIELAYRRAIENYVPGGVNRVILATDGDFNVGVSDTGSLVRLVEEKAKSHVFLTVLGFGMGNLNDAMLEAISGKGNGNYFYIDTLREARKVLLQDMMGTLTTVAKDVKIQVDFNPAEVTAYRLIGYENRRLRAEDFQDDTKDAGEIGAGHSVTALYELVPAGTEFQQRPVEPSKYQPRAEGPPAYEGELLTVRLRYKRPTGSKSTKLEKPLEAAAGLGQTADPDVQFAAAAALFGMLLRDSAYVGDASYDDVLRLARAGVERDPHGYRAEFIDLVERAKRQSRR